MIQSIPATFDDLDLKIGLVVRLMSGGPDMTIETIEGSVVQCCWFNKAGALKRASFQREMLGAGTAISKTVFVMPSPQDKFRFLPADVRFDLEREGGLCGNA